MRDALEAFRATGIRGRAIPAYIAELQGALAALEGRPIEAGASFDDALRRYRDLDLPWQVAQATLSMASVLDTTEPTVRATVDEGRRIMARLGATPFLRLMDAALARWGQSPTPVEMAASETAEVGQASE